jgi:hypothetical protein
MKLPSRFLIARHFAVVGLALFLSVNAALAARTWHVSGSGDDSANGISPSTAFRTLQKAANLVEPGDTVLVGDGIYSDASSGEDSAVLSINKSGRSDAWITWKAAPGAHPEIRPTNGWHGILIKSSYIKIDGFVVTGANDSIALIDALADGNIHEKNGKPYPGNPRFNANGISIEGRKNSPDQKPHHITICNCTVSKCPGGGITTLEADYVTIEDNRVFDNCWFMRYAGSGITFLNDWAHDNAPGYHIIVQRNLVWNNKTLVPWVATGKLSDGNGILLDVTDGKTSGGATNPNADAAVNPTGATNAVDPNAASLNPQRPVWKNRALIANNVSAFNGGSGIHTFRTRHVDIINNTTYWNGGIVGYQELFPNRSEDVVILNNIIVPRPGGKVTSDNRNTNIRWDYNLYPVEQKVFKGGHDIVADPQFVLARPDLREADFRLKPGSPGCDSGTDEIGNAHDCPGAPRPIGKARDRGAYEQ